MSHAPTLTTDEQRLNKVWIEHQRAECNAHSADETIATMVANPLVNQVPVMIGGDGVNVDTTLPGMVVVGPRLNLITASEDCDPIAATRYHKNVAVRLAAADFASSAAAEAISARIRSIAATPPALQGQ